MEALPEPSRWVSRFAPLIAPRGRVLDVACGHGRHSRFLAARAHGVTAVDRDAEAIAAVLRIPGVHGLVADLENGPWPFAGMRFAGVVVANYLHRPLLPTLMDSLDRGGVLIYETFAQGNERYGRPSNPEFLLRAGELLEAAQGLHIIAYEDRLVRRPKPAMVQRLCAVRGDVLQWQYGAP